VNVLRSELVFTCIKPHRAAFLVPTVASAVLPTLLAACGSSGASDATAVPAASTAALGSTNEVVVTGYKFPPISAAPGATLTLVDRDDEPHTVTADDGSFRAGPFNPKAPATLVAPTKPGTYPFHCEIHPTMHGALVVHQP
jgi:plastocyanin